ncbi:hypothetical protein MHZ92_01020 [Sporosarcina sp. ACRSL]|uniref:hypothetical protein n=1 Tax=Sporosarcina sp. ACRSL TaxID=2918215 RepID=UPI001EF6AC93|nr:hypothetical protein [Sporosarcina sp. ACRSL]MCG7342690.1 hypothetical protein [Sporosarcina sp. ACRSL]
MKLNWKLVCTGFAAAILLTACGTDNKEQNEGVPENEEQVVDETNGSSTDGTSTDTESDSGTASEVTESEDAMAEAVVTESDAQQFSIEVLPGYTLTSEEPGRDSLYADENPNAFMRIETQTAEEGTYDYLVDNMQEVLKASSNGGEPVEVTDVFTNAEDQGIMNVKAFKVDTDTGPVTGIVFEKDEMVVRYTLFDNLEEDYKTDFLNMGQTIN